MRFLKGDCLHKMREIEDNSIDSIVTDPPYGLKFMGKEWDHGVPGVPFWEEFLRVAKPGAHLLAFGGTRTHHRLMVAIEDAGWEIRDCIMWVYGSGFPKSLDVSKAIDKAAGAERKVVGTKLGQPGYSLAENKADRVRYGQFTDAESECSITAPATSEAQQWDGWGTALKPAFEPIVLARKPLEGTVAQNVQEYGTGGMNIDASRVETEENLNGGAYAKDGSDRHDGSENWRYKRKGDAGEYQQPTGRWPANFIHDGSEEVLKKFPNNNPSCKSPSKAKPKSKFRPQQGNYQPQGAIYPGDKGTSASRFFYCAKASKKERGKDNKHPTVKPLELMRYLVRLVTPPGGTLLDPFAGSGTTGIAAKEEGFDFTLIELPEDVGGFYNLMLKRVVSHKRTSK